jgi:superfamily II DNA or RNA helicase
MSVIVPINKIPLKIRHRMIYDLKIHGKESNFGPPKKLLCYTVEDEKVHLPYYYARNIINEDLPEIEHEFKRIKSFKFNGKIRECQKEVTSEAIKTLNKTGCVMLNLHCGFGKTPTAIYLCSRIKLKTAILTHRQIIRDQWLESEFWKGVKIQFVNTNTLPDPEADVYIMNVSTPSKLWKIHGNIFKNVGMLVVDEVHAFITPGGLKALWYFQPEYLVGMTATAERADGLSAGLNLYLGDDWVVRKLKRKHYVYTLRTKFEISMPTGRSGVDWNAVIKRQCESQTRNQMIVDLVAAFHDRNIIVLCKRVKQTLKIHQLLIDQKIDSDYFIANKKKFSRETRVLVASYSKAGFGMSHNKLDMLIIASDVVEMLEQYIGRVFRTPTGVPIIIDIVDKNFILQKHYMARKALYEECGGIIYNLNTKMPDFEIPEEYTDSDSDSDSNSN